jgi:hypothetical protein
MREAEIILARFPGPVTLHANRFKLFAMYAFVLGLGVFSAFLPYLRPGLDWYEKIMAALACLVCAVAAFRGWRLLLPGRASLTLDADGFETCWAFRRTRTRWQDVSGFGPQSDHSIEIGKPIGEVDVLTPDKTSWRRGATKATSALPDNYRLPKDDLVWLMDEWRERALARRRSAHTGGSAPRVDPLAELERGEVHQRSHHQDMEKLLCVQERKAAAVPMEKVRAEHLDDQKHADRHSRENIRQPEFVPAPRVSRRDHSSVAHVDLLRCLLEATSIRVRVRGV